MCSEDRRFRTKATATCCSRRPEVLELTDQGITEGRTQVAVGADDAILGFITTRPLDACVLEIEDLFVGLDAHWGREPLGGGPGRLAGRASVVSNRPRILTPTPFTATSGSSEATTPRPGSEAHLGYI
jgi:hypothetical protein